ncbi:MAG TPA: hypothetical protein VGC93_13250 [Thermoanaerobaculia bacterium]
MKAARLGPESPFRARLRAYLEERFPLLANGVLIVSYYSSNQFLAKALAEPEAPVVYDLHSLSGAVTLLCFFFHLRVFDEHKDYADDCRHYPERALQRGLVTLRHLRVLGAGAIAIELLLSALRGTAAFAAWAFAFSFSLLMLKEFFLRERLRRSFLIYAATHMLIMPLLALMVYSFATGRFPWQAPGWFWVYSLVGFFVTANWEVSRKIRAPEQEIDGVDSYTKVFGLYGAAYLVLGIRVVDTLMVALVGHRVGLGPLFYGALVALYLVCLIGFIHYRLDTNARTARRMETYAGMYIIAFDLLLAAEIARRQGVEVRW